MARFFATVFLSLLAACMAMPARAAEAAGPALVLDGDTIRIGETRVRLAGVDAPETDQSCADRSGNRWLCGIEARDRLSALIANRPVRCEGAERDRYDRLLAVCTVGGKDINRWLVLEGFALAYVKYSRAFVGEEERARAARRGLWQGAFIAPWDWRARNAATAVLGDAPGLNRQLVFAPQDAPPTPACAIKGNVNRKGERIFHMPGQRDYARVRMNSAEKRWFCSEEEAVVSGWRKAMR